MRISVVSPVYRGEHMIVELVQRISNTISTIADDFEIILVEDGSPDNSWQKIEEVCENNRTVKGIKLSRNFGQHYAITAGLEAASGDWVVVLDCDLQDQPEEIVKMMEKASEGYDIVLAQRASRQDSFLKRMSSNLFYKLLGYLTDTKQDASVANFGIYKKSVIDAVLSMQDYIRYFPTMVQWVGFDIAKVEVEHASRSEGESSYSWKSLIQLASRNIVAFSNKPLQLVVRFGFLISVFSLVLAVFYLFKYLQGDIVVLGFASVIISISLFSGLIIFTLGIIGVYLGKNFEQSKSRPCYIVHHKKNF